MAFKFIPSIVSLSFLEPFGFAIANDKGIYEIPFLDRMGFVFIICIISMLLISLIENSRGVKGKGLEIDSKMFKLNTGFAVGALIICGVLAALYSIYW